ncbi:MAG: efflux RND transporter permease subunit [Vicinamibacteria bacterium]
MTLSEICIRRPVLAIVLSLVIVLFGGVSLPLLGVREYPAVDPPVVSVGTSYPGAAASVVDAEITEPLEQAINGVAGVRVISSTSGEGRSNIRVEFNIDADLEAAANDVRDKVSQAVRSLPPDADPPVVDKADADSEPIMFMLLRSETRPLLEINAFAQNVILPQIQTIPGVSRVRIFGEKRYAMRLYMDPGLMAAHRVTPLDVQRAVAAQNVDLPSGRIEGAETELTIRTAGRLNTPAEFDRLVIRQEGGRSIVFGDVGGAVLDAEDLRRGLKRMGVPMIGVAVVPQPNTNAVAIADEYYRRMEILKKEIPKDIVVDVGYDFTTFVRRSVSEVEEALLIAFGLVALIIFLFLRDWRSTLIPVIAIPVSIVSAFFIMYLAGFTINVLTLVGVLLAIGLVCDDAIVVLENIYAKVEAGKSPLQAALEGSREIYFAVISTTITLAAVFVPIVFLEGLTGRLFREFGVVVAGSVLVSAFVALSLSPMMCRFMLRRGEGHGWLYLATEPFFAGMTAAYDRSLAGFLRRRWLALPIIAASVAGTAYLAGLIPAELAPLEDRSNIRINVRATEGATYEYTTARLDELSEYIVGSVPELRHTFSITGMGGNPNGGAQNIYLKEPHERGRSQQQIYQQLANEMDQFTGIRAFPAQPPTIGERRGGQAVQYVLKASRVETLVDVLPKFLEAAQDSPVLRFVDTDLKINRPEVSVRINRAKAAELGIPVADIGRTLQFAFGESRLGYFLMDGKQYQVIGQLQRRDRNEPADLKRVFVRAPDGRMVSLDNVIRYEETISPASIYRFNRNVSATVSGQPAPGYTLGQAIAELDRISAELLPATVSTDLAGQSRDFRDSAQSLVFAFMFALVLIYLVLAAQFESFVDPAIILLTVPLSVAGAVLSLWLTGSTLNVFSQIGIIMLIGLVTKNGILIVEFANQRKRGGLDKQAAVQDAAVARLRPILMTSLATILGALPIALALGSSAGSRSSMGIAVVGGLVFSGFLSLYIVPAVYHYLSRPVRAQTAEENALLGEAV